jgi:hypothetical protein
MNRTEPPLLATWILEHLMPAECNEALAGDLMESFRAGRSTGWYWRQVFAATALKLVRSLFRHRFVLIFAAAWAMLSPAWHLIFIRLQNQSNFGGFVWSAPWPWSIVCDFGLSTTMNLLFIWAGALIYIIFLLGMFVRVSFRRIGRGLAISIVGFIVASAFEFGLAFLTDPYPNGRAVDWRSLTLSGVVASFGIWTISMRMPYLIGTACALWTAVPKTESSVRLAK